MKYQDRNRLIDYTTQFPNKTFILHIPKGTEDLDWNLYKAYSEKVNFILCIDDLNLAKNCNEHKIKYYWSYPIFTWYELQGIINLHPCYLILNGSLFFSLRKVKSVTNIPIRAIPNLAYDAYIPRENGIYGTWIRPEDIEVYEPYIDTFEFIADELSREAVLLHIYKDNQKWPGNLNLLLTNFNKNVDNRAIPEEIGEYRVNCSQRCMEPSCTCHFCETAIKFSNSVRKRHYENLKKPIDAKSEDI